MSIPFGFLTRCAVQHRYIAGVAPAAVFLGCVHSHTAEWFSGLPLGVPRLALHALMFACG